MLPAVLIPAYKPNARFIALIDDLIACGFEHILAVDDGSGPGYGPLFDQARQRGCQVLTHAVNMGKGRAIKTGVNQVLLDDRLTAGVITADADGQHLAQDVLAIARAMQEQPQALVLGVRCFSGTVPIRNRIGNGITRFVFALVNGFGVLDTQSGLRGFSPAVLPFLLALKGERYDYEMNMLLEAKPNGVPIAQVPIETVYIDGNTHSHYRVVVDSAKIYALLIKYMLSSLLAGVVDYGVFALMIISWPDHLMRGVVTARITSSLVNFLVNRNLVFRQKGTLAHAAIRYYLLVVLVMLGSYGLITLLSGPLGINVYLAKVLTDLVLGLASFVVQREFVYNPSLKYNVLTNRSKK